MCLLLWLVMRGEQFPSLFPRMGRLRVDPGRVQNQGGSLEKSMKSLLLRIQGCLSTREEYVGELITCKMMSK